MRLPCPSTSTMSLPFAPSSTSCSAAPAMKSATTASTAMPHPSMKIPVCPVATTLHESVSQLQLRGHLPDIAVGTDSEDDERVDFRGATIGNRQIRRGPARIENADAMRASEWPELGIVTDEGVQPAPDLELALDRGPEPRLPLVWHSTAGRGDANQYGGRACPLRDAALEVSDDGNLATETQHVLDGLARLLAIEHRHDALGEVANARVRSLGRQRPELPVGDDEKAMLWCASHPTDCATRRSTPVRRSVLRSTAG